MSGTRLLWTVFETHAKWQNMEGPKKKTPYQMGKTKYFFSDSTISSLNSGDLA